MPTAPVAAPVMVVPVANATMSGMPPQEQPWLAFSRMRWRGGFERRLVLIYDDKIEVRAGRFAIETVTIPMGDVFDVTVDEGGALRVVAVPEDIVIEEGAETDRVMAAELIKRNAPPPRKKPKPQPKQPPPVEPPPVPPEPPKPVPPSVPEPKPDVSPEPRPDSQPAASAAPEPAETPEVRPTGVPDVRGRGRALRAVAILTVGAILTSVLIVVIVGSFVWVAVQLLAG